MHAVVKTVPGSGAVYEPWAFALKPGLRDIQVRVEATSICGTDMQIYDWHELMAKRVKPPLVMGHEFAGKAVEEASSAAPGMGMSAKGCSCGESTPTGASLSIIPFTRVALGSTTREFPLRRQALKNRYATLFTLRL